MPFSTFLRLHGDHHCACAQTWRQFSHFSKSFWTKKINALRKKNVVGKDTSFLVLSLGKPKQGPSPGKTSFVSDRSGSGSILKFLILLRRLPTWPSSMNCSLRIGDFRPSSWHRPSIGWAPGSTSLKTPWSRPSAESTQWRRRPPNQARTSPCAGTDEGLGDHRHGTAKGDGRSPCLTPRRHCWRGEEAGRGGTDGQHYHFWFTRKQRRGYQTGCQPSVYRYPEGHEQHCFSTPPSWPPDDVEEHEPTTTCSRALRLDRRQASSRPRPIATEGHNHIFEWRSYQTRARTEKKKRLLPKLKALQAQNIKSVHFAEGSSVFSKATTHRQENGGTATDAWFIWLHGFLNPKDTHPCLRPHRDIKLNFRQVGFCGNPACPWWDMNLAIGRKAPHVSLQLFNNSRDLAGRHRDRKAALRVASTGRSRWTSTHNSNAIRSTCASRHTWRRTETHIAHERSCAWTYRSLRSTNMFLDGCLPTLWRVAAYWTECVDGRHIVSRLSAP